MSCADVWACAVPARKKTASAARDTELMSFTCRAPCAPSRAGSVLRRRGAALMVVFLVHVLEEHVDLALRVVLLRAVALVELRDELVPFAFDGFEIVVG